LPLVIGYGNPLRGDDGFGWQMAQQLAGLLPEDSATVLAAHQLTPELAEPISAASRVLFVDARDDGRPGELAVLGLTDDGAPPATFSHDVDPSALLTLALTLYGRCPPAVILSVGGSDFGYGLGLSPAVEAATPAALERAAELLGLQLAGPDRRRAESCTR
jgi:hydrogenase maturation protease